MTQKKWPYFWIVASIVFACFLPDLKNELLDWDDAGYILENANIGSLTFETVRWAFTEFFCNYWAPLTWLSLAVDYAFWGFNPVGYHLTNNIFHSLNAGLFFLITYQMLNRYAARNSSRAFSASNNSILICSILAALFFGIHPLRVESVAWAAERKDMLSMLFGLGALLAYLKYTEVAEAHVHPFYRQPSYWAMLAFFLLSLLSKAMLITLPIVLFVLDWFPLRRLNRDNVRWLVLEKLPLLFLSALASLITMKAMAISSKTLAEINVSARVLTAFKSVLTYLRLSLLPIDISPVYFHPVNVTLGAEYIIAILLVMAISVWCAMTVRQRPVFLSVWLIFLITLFPVLGLTQNGPQEMAPRFTYMPGMALSILAAIGVMFVHVRISASRKWAVALWIGVLAILAGFAIVTVRDIGYWKNDVALWSRVIELQPHRFGRAYSQRAVILYRQGRYFEALADASEALGIAERKKYAALHELYALRARILKNISDFGGAAADFNKAMESSPEPFRRIYSVELEAVYRMNGSRARGGELGR